MLHKLTKYPCIAILDKPMQAIINSKQLIEKWIITVIYLCTCLIHEFLHFFMSNTIFPKLQLYNFPVCVDTVTLRGWGRNKIRCLNPPLSPTDFLCVVFVCVFGGGGGGIDSHSTRSKVEIYPESPFEHQAQLFSCYITLPPNRKLTITEGGGCCGCI